MEARRADVVIIGAGAIGCAIAHRLSRATDLRVVVVERGTPGCEASNAAAGVLAVASGHARKGVLLGLRHRSAQMFPALVAELEAETGIPLGYRQDGSISLAFSKPEAVELKEMVEHRNGQGMRCSLLAPSEARQLEPSLNPECRAAALFPEDCSIDSACLVRALVQAAEQRGVEFRLQTTVRSLSARNESVDLDLDSGQLEARHAIVAAGAWSAELLAATGLKVPLRPAHGEMAAVRPQTWTLRHVVTANPGYLVPRADGEVLIGSTTAFLGFEKRVTSEGMAALMARAETMVPDIGGTVPLRAWSGLRPCPTIRRPIIGFLPGLERVLLATGHHRNGILLAPITAQLVTELITGASPSVAMQPFRFRRH